MARPPRAPVRSFLAVPHFWSARRLGVLLALALAVPRPAAQSCEPDIRYGMNPSFHTWSSRAIVFADAFQRVRTISLWTSGAPQEAAPLVPPGSGRVGEGWPDPTLLAPGQRCGAYLFGSMEGTVPDGSTFPYVVTWRGTGSARLEGPYVAGERDRTANRVEVLVDPARGNENGLLSISWTTTDPADPVRDVHAWLPGTENLGRIFWPRFLKKVRLLNGGRGPHTWRTLDWTRVNDYGRPVARGGFEFDLAGVITPASPSQGTQRGVATAYQVALCNDLGMNLHLQLPHRTSALSESDYARFLEEQLRVVRDGAPGIPGLYGGRPFAGLDPALTVTVELSNEIWNSIFPVKLWMDAEAARKGITFTQQVVGEVQLLFDVADAVFAGPDRARLRKYFAGFIADTGYLERLLPQLRPGTHVDAVGAAAYLGPRRASIDAWLAGATPTVCPNCPDPQQLLDTASATVDILRPLIREHARVARTWTNPDGSHAALELYEGGINLKSAGQPWAAAARAIQTEPALFGILVDRFVPMLVEEGVDLLNWYSFMTDQDSPTVDAFGVWNDMGQSLSLPVVRPYADEGAPKAAVLCLGPPLPATCPLASATRRNGPGNFDTYSATPPQLGGLFRASVDLRPSGDTASFLVVSLFPTAQPLPWGPTLLASLLGADTLETRPGPVAAWEVRVPNDPSLAGLRFTTQAFMTGAGANANLSNAMDLMFGR